MQPLLKVPLHLLGSGRQSLLVSLPGAKEPALPSLFQLRADPVRPEERDDVFFLWSSNLAALIPSHQRF